MNSFFNKRFFASHFLSLCSLKYLIPVLFLVLLVYAPSVAYGNCCTFPDHFTNPCPDPNQPYPYACLVFNGSSCNWGTCTLNNFHYYGPPAVYSSNIDFATQECSNTHTGPNASGFPTYTCECGGTSNNYCCTRCSNNQACTSIAWSNHGSSDCNNSAYYSLTSGTVQQSKYDATCLNYDIANHVGTCVTGSTCSNETGTPHCVSKPVCSVTASASPNPIPIGQSSVIIGKTGSGYASCTGTGTFTQTASTQTYTVNCTGDSSYSDCKDTITVTKSACTNIGLSTPIINPASPLVNTNFTISCPTSKSGLSNVFADANTNSNPCSFTGWSGNTASFSCTGITVGHYEAKCYSTAVNGYCADSTTGGYTVTATPTSDTPCSRCSNDINQPCKNASWTNIGSCNIYSLKPGTSVSYTTNDSCDNCPSGKSCSSGTCIINPVVTHNECNTSQQCVPAPGSGTNLCSSNSGCSNSVTVPKTTLPGCTRANPTVTATNSPQTGKPGDTESFQFSVKNNDTNCGTATVKFDLTKNCPSGWTCTFNQNSVYIVPGSFNNVTLSVASPTNAASGNHSLSVTATDTPPNIPPNPAVSYSGTGNAIYIISSGTTHTECNTVKQCKPVSGSGTNLCLSPNDCNSPICSPYGTYDCVMANGCAGTKTCNYLGNGYGECYQKAPGCITPKYKCAASGCVQDDVNGTYTSSNCNNACSGSSHKYKCAASGCVQDDVNGTYTSSNCNNACSGSSHKYKCAASGCVQDDVNGTYTSSNCNNSCGGPLCVDPTPRPKTDGSCCPDGYTYNGGKCEEYVECTKQIKVYDDGDVVPRRYHWEEVDCSHYVYASPSCESGYKCSGGTCVCSPLSPCSSSSRACGHNDCGTKCGTMSLDIYQECHTAAVGCDIYDLPCTITSFEVAPHTIYLGSKFTVTGSTQYCRSCDLKCTSGASSPNCGDKEVVHLDNAYPPNSFDFSKKRTPTKAGSPQYELTCENPHNNTESQPISTTVIKLFWNETSAFLKVLIDRLFGR